MCGFLESIKFSVKELKEIILNEVGDTMQHFHIAYFPVHQKTKVVLPCLTSVQKQRAGRHGDCPSPKHLIAFAVFFFLFLHQESVFAGLLMILFLFL